MRLRKYVWIHGVAVRARGFVLPAFVTLAVASSVVACSAESAGDDAETSDDALTNMTEATFWDTLARKVGTIADVVGGPDTWTRPDAQNRWSSGFRPTKAGQENVLPGEAEQFGKLASDMQSIQKRLLEQNDGKLERAFHAKPHACTKAKMYVDVPSDLASRSKLPEGTSLASLKVGILADHPEPYDVWVRWSNGVGGRTRPDGEVDVRGLALKILGVSGPRLPNGPKFFVQERDTQDILLTNGATTPAPSSEAFAAFGVAQANMASAKGTAKLGALKGFFTYLVANPRVASTLVHKVVTSTKSHDGVLAQTFFSGGAIALGTEADGSPREAIKVSIATGRYSGQGGKGTCTPVRGGKQELADFVFPGGEPLGTPGKKGDPNYMSTGPRGVKKALAEGPLCLEVRVQFQRHDAAMLAAQAQPIEDTSVEWREQDSPWTRVAMVVVDRNATPDEEATCDALSWNPWHGVADHRPLGNIMRVRQEALAASAKLRGAK